MFLKILQMSQKTPVWESLSVTGLKARNFIKKSLQGVFLLNFRNFENIFFYRTPPVAASG